MAEKNNLPVTTNEVSLVQKAEKSIENHILHEQEKSQGMTAMIERMLEKILDNTATPEQVNAFNETTDRFIALGSHKLRNVAFAREMSSYYQTGDKGKKKNEKEE